MVTLSIWTKLVQKYLKLKVTAFKWLLVPILLINQPNLCCYIVYTKEKSALTLTEQKFWAQVNILNHLLRTSKKVTKTSMDDPNGNEETSCMNPFVVTEISLETFTNICKYLPPSTLFKVASVCKQFRMYLMSSENQDIWQTSRLEFLSYPKLPPPAGMTEQDYIKLTAIERGCQLCGTRKSEIKLHWEFRIRCCDKCYENNTTR